MRYERLTDMASILDELSAAGLAPRDARGLIPRIRRVRENLVSQYSESGTRPRGQPQNFHTKNVSESYRVLIANVENRLGDVIEAFGYSA